MSTELVLIDLSSIAHPIWHQSSKEPDPNHTSTAIVARVRALTSDKPLAAVCCDSGRSFRHEITDTYKANRPPAEAPLHHQIDIARELLAADGYPVWAVKGFEADDIIATAVAKALAIPDSTVAIVSADKDLLQLVGERVRVVKSTDGGVYDAAAVVAKFGVRPDQMRDYLTLCGDTSDNVRGAKGIGPKKAADLLEKFDNLDDVYMLLDANGGNPSVGIPTAVEMSLRDFRPTMPTTRQLITLRTDVEIPFEEISAERVSKASATFMEELPMETQEAPAAGPVEPNGMGVKVAPCQPRPVVLDPVGLPGLTNGDGATHVLTGPGSGGGIVVHQRAEVLPAPAEWERQLEPRSMTDAVHLAQRMYDSRLFSAYGTPQGVLATVLAGRELGMSAMASLRGFDIIDGRPTFKADLIRALVLKSGKAKYFKCTERSDSRATFKTLRIDEDDPEPMSLTFTIEEGRQAWSKAPEAWDKSGWGKNPADMLVARAGAKLARLVYPDVVHGLYAPEEFDR